MSQPFAGPFYNEQAAPAGGVSGSGSAPQIALWNALGNLFGSSDFTWDDTNKVFTVSDSGNRMLLIDKPNDQYIIGDIDLSNTGTRIIIDDSVRQIALIGGLRMGLATVGYGGTVNATAASFHIVFQGVAAGNSTVDISSATFAVGSILHITDGDNQLGLFQVTIDAGVGNTISYNGAQAQTAVINTAGESVMLQKITATKWVTM